MMHVRLPRLLDRNLNEVKRLYPRAQSAEISITPLSTASLALEEASGVRVRDFIELYNSRGTAGIYRVKSPTSGYGTDNDMISLEHGVCVLGDAIVHGEGTIKGTPRQVFEFLLDHQAAKVGGVNMWALGDVDVPETAEIAYAYSGTNTLNAILDVMEMIGSGYVMRFDQSAYPWVLHVKAAESEPSCEGRLGRNVVTARIAIDDSALCTRVYCPMLEGGYMQLEDDPAWGIVEHSLDFDEEMPLETVRAECRKYLEARKEPAISVEIDGLELAAVTGEALDNFDVGRMMRLALPKYGVVVNERITSISYSAMLDQPERVRIVLANKIADVSTSISSIARVERATANAVRVVRQTEKEVYNLKDSADGFKEMDEKLVKWFSEVGINLDAEKAQVGIFATYQETHDLIGEIDRRVGNAELILNGGDGASGLVDQMTEMRRIQTEDGTLLKEIDKWVGEAALILEGDGTSANAGLVARVKKNEEEISSAALTLYGDATGSSAGLVTRFGETEAQVTLNVTNIGSLFDIKADVTQVNELVAKAIAAEFARLDFTIAGHLSTGTLSASGEATVGGNLRALSDLIVSGDINMPNGDLTSSGVNTQSITYKGQLMSLKTHTRMVGGSVTEGATYKNYPVYKDGVQIGSVNIPSTWRFTPTWASNEVQYLGVSTSDD